MHSARPQLCATVTGRTTEELRARRNAARGADLVELRLDSVPQPDVAGALRDRPTPVIVTCRPAWEGGAFRGSEQERRLLLERALQLGADYVDVEWQAGFHDLVRRDSTRVVLSMHDFAGVPSDLADRYRAMRGTGAAVVKVAVTATRLMDMLPLMNLDSASGGARRVTVAMGAAGVASRILAARFGSCWTYAGEDAAPGQIDLDRMLGEYRFHRLSAACEVYGVVGRPIGHSLSPAMHNAGFEALGRDAVYVPLEAADADDFIAFATAVGVGGASVTAPYKQAMVARASETDEISRRVGALNTLKQQEGRWIGCNTDVAGFLEPLERRLVLGGLRAAVIGAGGAARAVAVALAGRGVRVAICARDCRKAEPVARLAGGVVQELPPAPGSWDLLVNTTPVGTHPDVTATPVPGAALDGRLVYDLVYNPRQTRLLAEAAAAGCDTIGGLEMLAAQAVRQFEWWTGDRPSFELFMEAGERRLAQMAGATAGAVA